KPCVQELPDFEKLGLETKNTKVKVLLVSMDFKENLSDKVLPFLQKNNYKTECVLLDEIDGNSFINKVNPKWSGAIPATYVTKQNKKQEEFVEKKLHYEEIKEILGKF
ncbi:MAG TPA: TlpA family protein disulfide reductase, partial [Bacteroidia bacterium]|nr:TlpA family protein disulfide reductase [Bacteroidia bacterium]